MRQGSSTTRLSAQQHKFLTLLVARLDQWVEHAEFAKAGIRNPADLKSKLLRKLESAGITLLIESRAGGYRLYSANA